MHALSDLTTLIFLNLLTLVLSIPVITAGAAYTSMHFCIIKMAEGDAGIFRTYWKQFKNNLRDVTPLWLIMLLIGLFIAFDYWMFYSRNTGVGSIVFVLVTLLAIVYLGIFVWIFPLSARFSYSVGAALHNAAILAIAKFPRTLVMMVITAAFPVLLLLNMSLYPVLFFCGLSLPAYLCQFIYGKILQDMVDAKNPPAESRDAWEEEESSEEDQA